MQNTRFAAGKRVAAGWRSARFISTACALWGMLAGALHAAPNEFQFLNSSYVVMENSPGFVSVPVLYTGGQTGAVTVVCATSGGTPGRYLATTNTLTFNPGEGTNVFTVLINDNAAVDGNDVFTVSLSNPGGGAVIGAPNSATVTILDDESPGIIRPANDKFTNATVIAGISGTVTSTNNFATKETGEPDHAGNTGGASVWFRWTAPVSGSVTFITSGNSFDTTLAAYVGTAVDALTPVASDDNSGAGLASQITFTAVAGTVYYVAVDGVNGAMGGYTLGWATAGSAGTFGFTSSFYDSTEREGVILPGNGPNRIDNVMTNSYAGARITITRSQGSAGKMRLFYRVSDGSAVRALGNYSVPGAGVESATSVTNSLVFFDGQNSASFLILPALNPSTNNLINTVSLQVVTVVPEPGESAAILAPTVDPTAANSTLFIRDVQSNTVMQRGHVRVPKYAGTGSVRVLQNGTANGLTFNWVIGQFIPPANLDAGSDYAQAGFNFVSATGSHTWVAGDGGFFDIPVTIRDDNEVDFDRDFGVGLTSGNTAAYGASTFTEVTIMYDDRVVGDHPAGSVDPAWNRDYFPGSNPPNNPAPGANAPVLAVAIQSDNKAVIGGEFTSVNSTPRNRIARMNADGSLDASFNPSSGANGSVNAVLAQPDGSVLFGGAFTSVGGVLRGGVARLSTNGTLDATFNPGVGASDSVRALAAYSTNGANQGRIVVVGDFTAFAGSTVGRIVRLNTDGSIDSGFNAGQGANGPIYAVRIQLDGKVVIAGNFTTVNGVVRNRIARLTSTGAVDTSFDPGTGADGPVYAIGLDRGAIAQSNVVVNVNRSAMGGQSEDIFDLNYGTGPVGTAFTGILTINYDFLQVPDYMNVYLGTNQNPTNLVFQTGLVSGANTIGIPFGPTTNRVIRIVMNQGSNGIPGTVWFYDATLIANTTGEVPVGAEKIIIGGEFNNYDVHQRGKIARLNPDGKVDTDYEVGNGADDAVLSISMDTNSLAVFGGLFTSFNGTRRVGVARLLSDGILDTSFMDRSYNQFAGVITTNSQFSQVKNSVRALAIGPDNGVYIGGSFKQIGGGGRNSSASGVVSPWGANVSTPFYVTRGDIRNRYNVAKLIGGATPGPGNISFPQQEYSVDEFAGSAFITVTRVNGNLGDAGAFFATGDRPGGPGAASSSSDYVATAGNLIWPTMGIVPLSRATNGPNNLSTNSTDDVYIQINDDAFVEGNEVLNLRLDLPQSFLTLGGEDIPIGVALGRSSATLTVVDDDAEPTFVGFATNNFTVDEGAGVATVTVSRSGNTAQSVSVDYRTFSGTAIDGQDFNTVFGSLTFGPGQTARTFTIPIIDDTVSEFDETISLTLTNLSIGAQYVPGGKAAQVTIYDNDYATGQLRFSQTNYTTAESAGYVTVAVQRTGGNVGAITAQLLTANGSAVASGDYGSVVTNLSWADGDTSIRNVNIPVSVDGAVEGTEVFSVRLTNAQVVATAAAVPLAVPTATVTLLDSDAFGSVQFASTGYSVSENGGTALITVTRVGGSSGTVSVNYATADGTATGGLNYTATTGTLVLGPGITSTNFAVHIMDDESVNPGPNFNRTVILSLNTFSNAALGVPVTALLTIVDNESVNEPAGSVDTTFNANAGADGFIYTLTLQDDGRLLIGGDFNTFNGIARKRVARLDANGNLDTVFNPAGGADDSVRAVVVQPDNRVLVGGFFTNIAGVVRNRITRLNVDGSTDTSFDPGAGADGPVFALARHTDAANAGRIIVAGSFAAVDAVTRPYVARLNTNGSVDVTFNTGLGPNGTIYAAAVQADGRVLVGGDFTTINGTASPRLARLNANGSLDTAFAVNLGIGFGDSVRAIAIQTDGRILVGGLFTNVNGSVIKHLARLNPDGQLDPSFVPNTDPTAGGDNSVQSIALQPDGKIIFAGNFQLFSGVTRGRVTRLNINGTVDPTINFGTGANNFVAASVVQLNDGKIVVGGGFTSFNGLARNYLARLYGGVIDGPGRVEFSAPAFTVNEGSTNVIVTARRIGGTTGAISANYATSDGSATGGFSVGPGVDYLVTAGTISFPNGEVQRTISIPIINDVLVEGNEVFNVALSTNGASGTTLGNQPVTAVTIVDDDSYVSFSSAAYTVNESVASHIAPVTLIRSGGTNGSFTVTLITSNLTATAGADYTAVTNIVSFLPGDLSKTVNVPILDDLLAEGDELLGLHLLNLSGSAAPGSPVDATLTIVDNDFYPGVFSFIASAFSVDENATNALITVLRTNGSSGLVTVNFGTSDGTATSGLDYLSTNGVLVFADGETNKTFTVRILPDTLIETNEVVILTLSGASGNAMIAGQNPAPLTIINNNEFVFGSLRLASNVFSVTEGAGNATITVIRTGGSSNTVTVDFATSDGTAVAGLDYVATNGTLTFLQGETSRTFDIPILADSLVESNETVNVAIGNPGGGASVGLPSSSVLTIASTNARPGDFTFELPNFSALENTGPAVITVLRTNGTTGNVSVDVRVNDGTAVAGVDYVGTNGSVVTLSWADGDGSPKSFNIALIDDPLVESPETVQLTLQNATGSIQTPAISGANGMLTILDNEVPAGSLDTGFPAGADGTVYGVVRDVVAAKIVVGGDFSTLNGFARGSVGRFNLDGTLDGFASSGFIRSGGTPTVRAVATFSSGPYAGKVVVVGQFDSVGGTPRANIVRLNSDGSTDTNFNTAIGPNGIVHAVVAQSDGTVFIGGAFTAVGTNSRPFIARLTASGALDSGFNPASVPNDVVRSLTLQIDGKIVAGGDFTLVGVVPNNRVARFNGDGSLDTVFAANVGVGADARVFAVQTDSLARILVGGAFTNYNGAPGGRLVRLNNDGTTDASFNGVGGGFNDSVLAIAAQADGKLLVGGEFTQFGGLDAGRIARLLTNGALDVSINFGIGANNFVDAIAVQDDAKIVIGGGFTQFDGATANRVARINGGENLGSGYFEFRSAANSAPEFGTNVVVTVIRRGGASNSVSVNFATADGSATAGADYSATNGTLTFAPGQVVQSITIPILDDTIIETNETFAVNLGGPLGGGAGLGSVTNTTVTIIEDDGTVGFGAPAYSFSENAGQAVVSVVRTGGTAGTVTVGFATTNGTAVAPADFTNVFGILTFAPGETFKTFNVPLVNDAIIEGNETAGLLLTNVTGAAVLGLSNAVLNIVDNDVAAGLITFSSATYSVAETGGTAAITLLRTNGSLGAVSVILATVGGTATAGSDYTVFNASVAFADGEASKTVLIPILDDILVEGDETVNLTVSAPTGGAAIGPITAATLTIVDDDTEVRFSSAVYAVDEGSGFALINVQRAGITNAQVTVDFATVGGGTALSGFDYLPAGGTLTFPPGDTNQSFTVTIIDDVFVEGTETINLQLSLPTGGAFIGSNGTARIDILDNDSIVNFTGAAYTVNETGTNALITLSRSGSVTGAATILYSVTSGTASDGFDFTGGTNSVNFAAGETNQSFLVPIINDTIVEANETVNLALIGASGGANIGVLSNAVLTIFDDDLYGSISFDSATYSVTEAGGSAVITLVRTNGSSGSVSVNFATADGTAVSAGTNADYVATNGVIVFGDGETNKSFTVVILDDTRIEADETVLLTLSNPAGGVALGGQPSATLIILNDDFAGTIAFANTNLSVNESAGVATVTVSRTGGIAGAVSVNYAATAGTATSGVDFTATSGTLIWADGDSANKTFQVTIANDGIGESDETVILTLSGVTGGATLATPPTAVLTIVDDDRSVAFSSTAYSASEAAGSALITINRLGLSSGAVSVSYFTTNGTATSGQDYSNTVGTVFWADGDASPKTFTVPVINDPKVEGDETVRLLLASPSGATIAAPGEAVLTIVDDDVSTTFVGAGAVLLSESGGVVNGIIEPGETVTVSLALRNIGTTNSASLNATLQATNGVTPVIGTNNYGVVLAGGPAVARTFSFMVSGTNGGTIVAVLQLQDGSTNHGAVPFVFNLGTRTNKFTSTDPITLNDAPRPPLEPARATPYPSSINVSGIEGVVGKLTVTISNLTHTFPADIDMLLVSPTGQRVVLMSDAGSFAGAPHAVNNVSLTFDDQAAAGLTTNQIVSGTFKPTNLEASTADFWPAPAPLGPHSTNLSAFNGINPNGAWQLFIVDDTDGDAGVISGGWSLTITEAGVVNPQGDIALSAAVSPSSVVAGQSVVYTLTATNAGSTTAKNVAVTNVLPAGLAYGGITNNNGTFFLSGNTAVFQLGTVAVGSARSVTFGASTANAGGFTNVAAASSTLTDGSAGNNTASVSLSVSDAVDLGLTLTDNPDPVAVGADLTYLLVVTNRGPSMATGVVLTNALPAGVNFGSVGSTVGTVSQAAGVVTANIGTLASGASVTVTIIVQPTASGTITDSASVTAVQTELNAADNAAGVKTTVTIAAGPTLAQRMVGTNVEFSWPVSAGSFEVVSTLSLTPPVTWTPVPGTLTTVGNLRVLTAPVNPAEPTCFYRLRSVP